MKRRGWEQAHNARILCAITFHFNLDRVVFLAETLRSLSEYPITAMDIAVVTNTSRHQELALLRRLCAEILADKSASIRSYTDLTHPFDLTWCHKAIIAAEFVGANHGRYTHFIYLEDDIRLSYDNFCYFVEFREYLRAFGLLPAFVRVEYSAGRGGFVASDAFWPVYVPLQCHIPVADVIMLNMPNPYNPCFILDLELAEEYVRSRSFEQDASQAVCGWGVRERAAMGLCLEKVPAPFRTRYVVPVSRDTSMPPGFAWIWHLPNTYGSDPYHTLGKVRIDSLFAGVDELATAGTRRDRSS
jgi:hypothetical protein